MFLFLLCDFPSSKCLNFLNNDIFYEQMEAAVIALSVVSYIYRKRGYTYTPQYLGIYSTVTFCSVYSRVMPSNAFKTISPSIN